MFGPFLGLTDRIYSVQAKCRIYLWQELVNVVPYRWNVCCPNGSTLYEVLKNKVFCDYQIAISQILVPQDKILQLVLVGRVRIGSPRDTSLGRIFAGMHWATCPDQTRYLTGVCLFYFKSLRT